MTFGKLVGFVLRNKKKSNSSITINAYLRVMSVPIHEADTERLTKKEQLKELERLE